MAKKHKQDYSIIVNILFVAIFIAAGIFVYKVFGIKDINSIKDNASKVIQEKNEQQLQLPAKQAETPKEPAMPFKKFKYKFTFDVGIQGAVKNLEITVPVSSDEQERQYISDTKMSFQPTRLYNDGVSTFAEYKFDNVSDQHIKLDFEGVANVRTYNIVTAKILNKNFAPEKDLTRYLQPEPYIESDDPYIKNIASKIKGDTREQIVQQIYEYEQKNIKYTLIPYIMGAKKTLKEKQGKCSEYAAVMVALCRAKNIPARIVMGYFARDNNQQHDWVEVYYDEYGWVMYDPTQKNIHTVKDANGRVIKEAQDFEIKDLGIYYISTGRNSFKPIELFYNVSPPQNGQATLTRSVTVEPLE